MSRARGVVSDEARAALVATLGRLRDRELDVKAARDELSACIEAVLEEPGTSVQAVADALGFTKGYVSQLRPRRTAE